MYLILRFWSLSGVLPFLASSCTVSGGGAVNLRSCKSPFLANFTKTHSEIFDLYPELPTYQPTMSDLSKIVLIVTVYPIFILGMKMLFLRTKLSLRSKLPLRSSLTLTR